MQLLNMDKNLIFPKYHVLTNNSNDLGLSERNYKQCNSIQVDQEKKNNFRYAYLLKQKGLFRALFIGKT